MNQKSYHKADHLTILSANCINRISPLANCAICQQLCPAQALAFTEQHWQAVDCTLCGLCVSACPTGTFQIDYPALLSLPKAEPLQLCCARNALAPQEALRLNCLQQLSPLTILELLYRHGHITLYLTPALCQQCAHQWYAVGLQQQLAQYQIPSERLQIILQEPQLAQDKKNNSRRALFQELFQRTETQSKKALTHNFQTLAANPIFAGEETQEEAAAFPSRLPLYAFYAKKELPVHSGDTLPFRALSCQACNFCGACANLCPTQALTITTTDSDSEIPQKELLFHPELCIGCNLCQQICMQHKLQWEDFMTQQQFVQTPHILAQSSEKICSQCGHAFYQWPPSDEKICPYCH